MKNIKRSQYAYQEVKKLILSGKWQPGQYVSSYELSDMLNISRTPVTEALKRLESEGFVKIESQVGCVLKKPDIADLKERFLILSALEGLAAEEAAKHITKDEIEKLKEILDSLKKCIENQENYNYEEMNRSFHLTIAQVSGLPQLAQLIQFYFDSAKYFAGSLDFLSRRIDLSYHEHQMIFEALKEHNGQLAKELLSNHSKEAANDLDSYIDSELLNNNLKANEIN